MGSMPWLNRFSPRVTRHTLPVRSPFAEQASFDPVGAGQHGQLGVGDRGAAVVVGVDRQAHVLAAGQVPAHPLDLVGVDVRRGPLDRARRFRMISRPGPGLPDVHDALADVQREVEFGVHEDLGEYS